VVGEKVVGTHRGFLEIEVKMKKICIVLCASFLIIPQGLFAQCPGHPSWGFPLARGYKANGQAASAGVWTYLHQKSDNGPRFPHVAVCTQDGNGILLAQHGLSPGDWTLVYSKGEFEFAEGNNQFGNTIVGVFSSNSTIDAKTEAHRVPGAINAGVDFVTAPTFHDSEPTDIPEDFLIKNYGAVNATFSNNNVSKLNTTLIQIPAGAQ